MYKPLPYGSKEYMALRRTEKTTRSRATIGKRVVIVEHTTAAGPGLWTFDGADLWTVSVKASAIPGLSNNVTENIGQGATREEALAKAAKKLGLTQ